MNLRDEFLTVLGSLADAGIEHAVCGGFAVAIHGYPRLTQDIDLLVRAADLERAREVLRRVGFTIEGGMLVFDGGRPTEHHLWRVSKADGEDLVTVDLLLAEGMLAEVWETREVHALGDRQVTVVSTSGLRRMKLAAGRRKDLDDLEQLGLLPEDADGRG
jgi:hypothetical protein